MESQRILAKTEEKDNALPFLGIDMLITIMSYLAVADLLTLLETSKSMRDFITSTPANYLWKLMFTKHFPSLITNKSNESSDTNWFQAVKQQYQEYYSHDKQSMMFFNKKMIMLFKTGDVERLKRNNLTFEQLTTQDYPLYSFAFHYRNQNIIDYLYDIIEKFYQTKEGEWDIEKMIQHKETFLNVIIDCNPSPKKLQPIKPILIAHLLPKLSETSIHYAMWQAIQKNRLNMVKILLATNKIDLKKKLLVNRDMPLNIAVKNGCYSIVKYMIQQGVQITPENSAALLFPAISANDYRMTKLLIDNRADINVVFSNGLTPLQLAAEKKDQRIVKLLNDAMTERNTPPENARPDSPKL